MAEEGQGLVSLADDGFVPPPAEMAARLAALTRETDIAADYYGNGGAVAAFEAEAAALLGKERAVMFPTGTLANLLAVQALAGEARRIVVHRQSHLFNDSGDNLSRLGGFTMVPLEGEGAGFSAADVEAELARTADARVASGVGCIAIESPNRRLLGQRFAGEEIAAIAEIAQSHDVPMFLDGARMLIECAYTGVTPAAMAAPFDLVYLSLYKYLAAPFGCVIAGPAELLDDIFHQRRRFGGSLYQMWPAAVLASDALANHAALWAKTRPASEAVIAALQADARVSVERPQNGTNIVCLGLAGKDLDAEKIVNEGRRLGLALPAPASGKLPVKINETWLRRAPDDIADRIAAALIASAA